MVSLNIVGNKKGEVYECNYEEDCPALYEAIETAKGQEDYDKILRFLETAKWDNTFFSLGSDPVQQTKTWVTRFDYQDHKKVKWSQLPLHLAIVCGVPFDIVKKLVELYPQALRCTDDQHMLPLHLALRHGATDEIVAFLIQEFPEGINAKGKSGRSSVDCALRAKSKKERGIMLQNFVERTKGRISSNVINERAALKKALEHRKTEVATLQSELEAQYSVIDKLRGELSRAKGLADVTKQEMVVMQDNLLGRIRDLEATNDEISTNAKEKTDKLENAKLADAVKLQKKVEKLENSKKELETLNEKMRVNEKGLRNELEAVQEKVAKSVSPEDWARLQDELEELRGNQLQQARSDAKSEIESLKDELDAASKAADDKSQLSKELKTIKRSVNALNVDDATLQGSFQLRRLRDEVAALRYEMKSQEEASRTKVELAVMKKAMEVELKNAKNKTQEEVEKVRKAVKLACEKETANKTAEELASVKAELDAVKKEMVVKELYVKTKQGVEELKDSLGAALKAPKDETSKSELLAMKSEVDGLQDQIMPTSSESEIIAVQTNVDKMKDELKKKTIHDKIEEEAKILKNTLEEEIKKAEGKTQEELMEMKQAMKVLTDKKVLQEKNAEELHSAKAELDVVKVELKNLQDATRTQFELGILKKALEVQLVNENEKTVCELEEMKKAVDTIDMENKESKKLKKELTEEIKKASGKTEVDLLAMKKKLDEINLAKLESKNKDDWEAVRKEMASLKEELQQKQSVEMSAAERELAAMKKVVDAINVKAIETKNNAEFDAVRKEMDVLKEDLKKNEDCDDALRKAIDDLKLHAKNLSPVAKKDKKGLKKFLSRRFSRVKPSGSLNSDSNLSFSHSIDTDMADDTILETPKGADVPTFLPPCLSSGGDQSTNDASSADDSSEDKAVVDGKPPLAPTTRKTEARDNMKLDVVQMTRTSSKIDVKDNGDVEMEAVNEPVSPPAVVA